MIGVHRLTAEHLFWTENDRQLVQWPAYKVGGGTYKRNVDVDPCPCYAHSLELVTKLAESCWEKFPLEGAAANLYLLSHEYTARNNGIAFEDWRYENEKGEKWPPVKLKRGDEIATIVAKQALTICLAGKRIPPMPSMTRYLVTHEYGHLAWYRTNHLMGRKGDSDLYREYMEMRGCPEVTKTGSDGRPCQWHERPSEIVANDFRILVMETEKEFWPHDVVHPSFLPTTVLDQMLAWWKAAADLVATGTFDPAVLYQEPEAQKGNVAPPADAVTVGA